MKKSGCFFTTISIITIAIGILFYIGKKYGPEILEAGKEKLLSIAENDINEKLDKVKESEYKDSLIVLINKKIDNLKNVSFGEMEKDSSEFFERLDDFIKDNIIDSEELSKLTEIYQEYER